MRIMIFGLLLFVGVSAPPASNQPPPNQPPPNQPPPGAIERVPPGMTELDGHKNPELIPDHVVWRMTFNFLAEVRKRGEEADIADLLPLGKADLDALYKEASNQRQRDDSCQARYRARETELVEARTSSDKADAALDEVLIDCRTQVLDASDRVMDSISQDGRQILATYIERRRHSTSALVPQRELKNFRLPR
jgi:hypothetical protein